MFLRSTLLLCGNRLENTQLLSPISGVVTARNYDNGDMPGNMPILTIESLSPVKMIINVSENYYPRVKKGMGATVKLEVYGDEGIVDSIMINGVAYNDNAIVLENGRVYRVEISATEVND